MPGIQRVSEQYGFLHDPEFRRRVAGPVGREAVCSQCGEAFNPTDDDDLVHIERQDGTPCGGHGQMKGQWQSSRRQSADTDYDNPSPIMGLVQHPQTGVHKKTYDTGYSLVVRRDHDGTGSQNWGQHTWQLVSPQGETVSDGRSEGSKRAEQDGDAAHWQHRNMKTSSRVGLSSKRPYTSSVGSTGRGRGRVMGFDDEDDYYGDDDGNGSPNVFNWVQTDWINPDDPDDPENEPLPSGRRATPQTHMLQDTAGNTNELMAMVHPDGAWDVNYADRGGLTPVGSGDSGGHDAALQAVRQNGNIGNVTDPRNHEEAKAAHASGAPLGEGDWD